MGAKDLFLSYNGQDRNEVDSIRQRLERLGVTAFMDRTGLTPGLPFVRGLQDAISEVRAVAIFLGPAGFGEWQQKEVDLALDLQTGKKDLLLIPVILPGGDPPRGFLKLNTWVDLRRDDSLAPLVRAVRSEPEEAAAPAPAISPYRGLQPFREEDADLYFGRETDVDRLAEAVDRHGLVAVIGASGSGKSSLVRAGLVPRLRRKGGWSVVRCRPGAQPFRALAQALIPLLEPGHSEADRLIEEAKLSAGLVEGDVTPERAVERVIEKSPATARLLLLVDQLEELFTLAPAVDRARFAAAVLRIRDLPSATVVLTLRADYYPETIELARELVTVKVDLTALGRTGLRQVIAGPAGIAGLELEPGLVERILGDAGDDPGALPLLEFTLDEVWKKRDGRRLTHDAYDESGGVRGSIARRADELFDELSSGDRAVLRRLMTDLVHFTPTPGAESRRRLDLDDLEPTARTLALRLAVERLLVTGRDPETGARTVEIAHEALIREWPRFREWLDDDRELRLWYQRFRPAVDGWLSRGRDPGDLFRGHPLARACDWLRSHGDELDDDDRAFIAAGVAAERRSRRLRHAAVGALAALTLLALGLAAWVRREQLETERRQRLAEAQLLARQAVDALERRPQRAVLLAAEALRRREQARPERPLPEVDEALYRALANCRGEPFGPQDERVAGVVLAADGGWLATVTADERLRLLPLDADAEVRGPAQAIDTGGRTQVLFDSRGRWLAASGEDVATALWRLAEGTPEQVFETAMKRPELAFSPDGTLLATGGNDGMVRLRDLDQATEETRIFAAVEDQAMVTSLAISPRNRWLVAVRGGEAWWWDLEAPPDSSPEVLPGSNVQLAVFDPAADDRLALIADWGFSIWQSDSRIDSYNRPADGVTKILFGEGKIIVDLAEAQYAVLRDHDDSLFEGFPLSVSPIGRWLAVAAGGSLRLSDLSWQDEDFELRGHDQEILNAAFTASGTRLLTWGSRGRARRWDLASDPPSPPHEPRRLDRRLFSKLAFSPGGERLFAADRGGAVLWNVAGEETGTPAPLSCPGWPESADALFAASADGRRWARIQVAVCVWDLAQSPPFLPSSFTPPVARGQAPLSEAVLAAVSADGQWVAIEVDDVPFRSYDPPLVIEGGVRYSGSGPLHRVVVDQGGLRVFRHGQEAFADDIYLIRRLAIDAGGRWLVTLTASETLLWDLAGSDPASSKRRLEPPTEGDDPVLVLSHDGRWLFTGGSQDRGRLWDLPEGGPYPHAGATEQGVGVGAAAFSPDDRWLAVGKPDGRLFLWDLTSQDPGADAVELTAGAGSVTAVAFSDGGRLFAATGEGDATLWTLGADIVATKFPLPPVVGAVRAAAFSPGGDRLATAGDGGLFLWELRPEMLLRTACAVAGRDLDPEELGALGGEPVAYCAAQLEAVQEP